jgi:hypothetical protein
MGCPWLWTSLMQGARSFSPSLSVLFLSLWLFIYVISCIACLDPHLVSKISYQLQPDSGSPWPRIFGSFILYLLVNKIRVFCALVNETGYSCGRFSILVVWFLAYYYILLKVFWRLAFLHRLWSYYCLSFLLSISYYLPITQVFIIGAFLMLCVHVISWKKIGWAQITGAADNILFAENEVVSVQVAGGPETIMRLWVF